jgi:RNA-directed DNA polymerase
MDEMKMGKTTLYQGICSLDNLYQASHNAQKGKKSKNEAAKFWFYEDRMILQMQQELQNKCYKFGGYRAFILYDNGVERRISVAPFRDRVLHHAIMLQIEPLFEKSFIYDSYANRKGKGTLNALKRARYYANKYDYVLQLDIRKFFPTIDHQILMQLLGKKVTCRATMDLLGQLIANSNKQDDAFFYFSHDDLFTPYERKKGIPLGNLTSQFFGNLYLNPFDHFVKEELKVEGYIRYVDDTLYFSNSKQFLQSIIQKVKDFLGDYRLKIHPMKVKIFPTQDSFVFLGHKVFQTHFRLTSKSIRRGRKKLCQVRHRYNSGAINLSESKNRIFGIIGFFKMGRNDTITNELLAQTVLSKNS